MWPYLPTLSDYEAEYAGWRCMAWLILLDELEISHKPIEFCAHSDCQNCPLADWDW